LAVVVSGDAGGIARDDLFVVRRIGNLGQVFVNGAALPSVVWDVGVAQTVTVNGLLGNDRLTIDHASGDPLNPSGLTFAGGAGTDELIVNASASADIISLATSTVQVNGRPAAYADNERITLNLGAGNDTIIASGNGSATVGVVRINITSGSLRPASGTTLPQFTDIDILANTTFNLNGVNTQVNNLTGSGRIITDAANATLSIGVNNGSFTFNGTLANGTATLALTKQGTGRATLGGNNTFGGLTNIVSGALRVAHDNALGSTGSRTIVAGGTNTGVLELSGGRILAESIELAAKSALPDGSIPNHLISVDGFNTVVSNLQLQGGGTGHTLRVDSGILRLAGEVNRLDGSTYHRPLHLRGAGEGRVDNRVTTASATWGVAYVKYDSGTWTVRDTTALGQVTVNAGRLEINRVPGSAGAVIHGGTLAFRSGIRPGDVNVSSVIPSISFGATPGGTFDLGNNAVVLNHAGSSPASAVRSWLASGYNAGTWSGTGLITSRASMESGMALGYAEASDLFSSFPATVAGKSVDSTSLVVRYTVVGDADLDGAVGFADLLKLSQSYGQSNNSAWSQGDFNYDGAVDFDDILLLAQNYGRNVEFARGWSSVAAANFAAIPSVLFLNSELDLVQPLYHFHTLANSVVETGPHRGFIDASVWRDPQDNQPYNARILENQVAFAQFYTTNRTWNPYYNNRDVRDRLEAIIDFWIESQDDRGWHAEYSWTNFSLAPTSFGLRHAVRTLELLNAGGPDIDPVLKGRFKDAVLKGVRAMTQDSTLLNAGNDYTNQYSAVWASALRFSQLYPEHASEINANLAVRSAEMRTKHQSPAGFHYEAGAVDWAYTVGTHGSNLNIAWDLLRGSTYQQDIIDEASDWYQFASYNLIRSADGASYLTNMGVAARLTQRVFEPSVTYSLSEFVPEARILNRTAAEENARIINQRASLASSWGNWGTLNTSSSSSFPPTPFEALDRVAWRPTVQQRTDAVNALPYLADDQFIQQNVDSRRPLQFTYVRNPSYYAAMNTGSVVASQQRYGLGAIWNPAMGAVFQTQSGSDNAAWGTRSAGAVRVLEAATINASFAVDGIGISPTAGERRLADGTMVVTYGMGSGRSKTLTFDATGITVVVTHPGSFSEEFPILLRGSESLAVNSATGVASFSRNGTTMRITYGPGISASVINPGIASFAGHNLRTLVVNASGSLTYRIEFVSGSAIRSAGPVDVLMGEQRRPLASRTFNTRALIESSAEA
jgi:autotransporter-associated beta strand protein